MSKRQYDDNQDHENKRARTEAATRVVFVRGIPTDCSESELLALCCPFAVVEKTVLLNLKGQAFVQLPDVAAATNLVEFYKTRPTNIRSHTVFFEFSSRNELSDLPEQPEKSKREAVQSSKQPSSSSSSFSHSSREQSHNNQQGPGVPSTILMVSVSKLQYDMTVDILQQVFSKFGHVSKVVTFNKNESFNALVEMKTISAAEAVQTALDGRDIYTGCNTLHIIFSKHADLRVRCNNDRSRDFNNPNLPAEDPHDVLPSRPSLDNGHGRRGDYPDSSSYPDPKSSNYPNTPSYGGSGGPPYPDDSRRRPSPRTGPYPDSYDRGYPSRSPANFREPSRSPANFRGPPSDNFRGRSPPGNFRERSSPPRYPPRGYDEPQRYDRPGQEAGYYNRPPPQGGRYPEDRGNGFGPPGNFRDDRMRGPDPRGPSGQRGPDPRGPPGRDPRGNDQRGPDPRGPPGRGPDLRGPDQRGPDPRGGRGGGRIDPRDVRGLSPVLICSNVSKDLLAVGSLFAFFGCFGNVMRIKILYKKQDTALIEYSDLQHANRAIEMLDGLLVMGTRLRVANSLHFSIVMPGRNADPFEIKHTADFTDSPLHRYKYGRNFKHIVAPCPGLHISGISPEIQGDTKYFHELFSKHGKVEKCSFFEKDSRMVMIDMVSLDDAVKCITILDNFQARGHHIRVAFSKAYSRHNKNVPTPQPNKRR